MSYQVIARKYRPQVFDELSGQALVRDTLKNAIRANRVAHGYIFSGARGVGKTTTARILAKSLNCAHGPTVTPCGECASCREIAVGNSVDVLEIDAASNRGIDEIRQLRENVRYLPARDRYKVFIIDEVHMLTTEAFNALLKTLEEPPERSLFILATTEAHKLPATIQSRCQHFAFRLLDYAEILARLKEICEREGVAAPEGALSSIAVAAEGSLRDALSFLDAAIAACGNSLDEEKTRQLLGVVPFELLTGIIEAIHAGDSRRVLEQVGQLGTEGYDLGAFCGELTRYVRNLMIARSCGVKSSLLQVPENERAKLEQLSALYREEDLSRFFQVLLHAQSELRYSLHPRFHLELALMKMVHTRKLMPLEALLSALRRPGGAGPLPRPGLETASPSQRGPGAAASKTWSRDSASPAPAAPPKLSSASSDPAAPGALSGPAGRAASASQLVHGATESKAVDLRSGYAVPSPASVVHATETKTADPTAGSALPLAPQEESNAGANGEDARFAAIKAILYEQSKFLSSCLNPVAGWRFENGQVHFVYSKQGRWAAELLRGREHQEKLRAACEKVLGQPVKIYVTLNAEASERASAKASAPERAQRDPGVAAFQETFDCVILDVKDLSRE
ncbi:MAG: DNA polymerase III subunit gamma/tau [Terriglobia bacterium]